MKPKEKKTPQKRHAFVAPLLISVSVVFLLATGLVAVAFFLDTQYRQKVFPGVRMDGTNVSGLTYVQLFDRVEGFTAGLAEDGLPFRFRDHTVSIPSILQSPDDPDLIRELITFDAQKTVDDVYAIGRSGDFWRDQRERFRLLLRPRHFPVVVTVDNAALELALDENFSQDETPPTDAALTIGKDGTVSVTGEKPGQTFAWAPVIGTVLERIAALSLEEVFLTLQETPPQIRSAETAAALADARSILALDPPTLLFEGKSFPASRENLRSWLALGFDGKPTLTFSAGAMDAFFDRIAKDVEVEPKEGKFTIDRATGKVSEFQKSQVGRAIDRAATRAALEERFLGQRERTVPLAVTEKQPQITTDSIADLGIKEIVGVGTSNMKGSPKNRRFNIGVGAAALHGLVIKPGEEFSLVGALGDIDGAHGYRQEMVIKGTKTIPEFGGGLCQIGTTTFRAAMGAGLPITERQNHSYTVRYYYEDGVPGTDATIYGPHPDFRFLNDTGHHLLLQTRIEGDTITFEFWGTKDGRIASRTKPVLSNKISPPPPKTIETSDLKPGERKCTEKAHTGLTAQFTYTVKYPDGKENVQKFTSRYKPWQEVCLVGKTGV